MMDGVCFLIDSQASMYVFYVYGTSLCVRMSDGYTLPRVYRIEPITQDIITHTQDTHNMDSNTDKRTQHFLYPMKGGRLLGQGAYGCVLSPGFTCASNGNGNRNGTLTKDKKIVSKIQKYNHTAKNEIAIGKRIARIPNASSYVQVFRGACPVNLNVLKEHDTDLQQCTIPKLDKAKTIMLSFSFIEGKHPYKVFQAKANPLHHIKQFILRIVDALKHLEMVSVVHHDLKNDNILISKGRPLLIDFGMGMDMQQESSLARTFYAPEYEIWAPDIQLYNEQTITDKHIEDIVFYTLRPLNLMVDSHFLEQYRMALEKQLRSYQSMSWTERKETFRHHWRTWDMYSLGWMILEILFRFRTEGHILDESKLFQKCLHWALKAIHPNPARRLIPTDKQGL